MIYCEAKVGILRAHRDIICQFWRPGAAEDMVPICGSKMRMKSLPEEGLEQERICVPGRKKRVSKGQEVEVSTLVSEDGTHEVVISDEKNEDGQGADEKAHGCHRKKFDFYLGVL